MKATHLSGKNVKGQTFAHQLAPITLFCGENESGKTARATAAKLALMGYDLKLGKVAAKTFKLASGDRMAAGLVFEDGRSNNFSIQKKGDSCSVLNKFAVESPGILLNEKEYLEHKNGGPGRQRFLFDLAAKDMKFEIGDLIADMKSIKLEPHPPEAEPIIVELCDWLEQADQIRFEMSKPLDEWFADLCAKMSKKVSEATAIAKQHRNAIQASVSNQSQAGIAIPQDKAAEIKVCRDFHEAIRDVVTKINTRFAEVKAQRDARVSAARELAENPVLVIDLEPLKSAAAMAKTVWETAKSEKKIEVTALDSKAPNLRLKKRDGINLAISKCNEAISGHEATILRLETNNTNCDKCGSDHTHWNESIVQAVKEMMEREKASLAAMTDEVAKLNSAKLTLQNEINADVEASAKYVLDLANAKVHNEAISQRIQTAHEVMVAANQEVSQAEGSLKVNKSIRDSADKRLCETPLPPGPETLKNEILSEFGAKFLSGIEIMFQETHDLQTVFQIHLAKLQQANSEKLQALEVEQEKFLVHTATLANREESRKTAEESELREKIYDAGNQKLIDRQKKVISDGIKKFMDKASAMTKAVLGFSLEFRDGDIGYFDGGQWVSYETFSGIQEALAFAGLRLSFAQDAPCKMLVIDELGTFSKKNKGKLLDTLVRLVQNGFLDNFIGMDVSSDDYGQIFSERPQSESNLLQLIEIEDNPKNAVNQ